MTSANRKSWDAISKVFAQLGHAPLQDYLSYNDGELVPHLHSYACEVWREALQLAEPHLERNGGTIAIFSHAVFAQATARFASLSLGGEEAPMLAAPLEEVGGFVLSPERRNDERKRWHVERV